MAAVRTLDLAVIDTDTHVTEPPDVWTSRVSKKHLDKMPHVEIHPNGEPRWRIMDHWLFTPGHFACTGFDQFPPQYPVHLEDVEQGAFDPHARLARMDEYGIYAQVLFPNIIGFETRFFIEMGHEESLEATRAYNDFLTDFASADPKRLLPITMPPFWDLEAAVKEIRRCHANGHRGILFANRYEMIGLPQFSDTYWDPIYRTATELGMSINFHIGFSGSMTVSEARGAKWEQSYDGAQTAADQSINMMYSNATTIAHLVTCGLLDRFPELNFVSIESGFGYLPYMLESLDWHWHGYGMRSSRELLPSEYFARQCFGAFWFESSTLPLLGLYPDSFLFSTDYPHPTSVSPGPCSPSMPPREHIETYFQDVPEDVRAKVLSLNAARLYGVDVSV